MNTVAIMIGQCTVLMACKKIDLQTNINHSNIGEASEESALPYGLMAHNSGVQSTDKTYIYDMGAGNTFFIFYNIITEFITRTMNI